MSKLRKEIKSFMSGLHDDGQELSANFCFSKEFIGFQGHFSDKPVLPGVCNIQAILCMLREATGMVPELKEIVLSKFFNPVFCNEKIVFKVRRTPEGSEVTRVLALVNNKDNKVAEIRLKVIFKA